jgi:hypothetical protein
MLRAATELVCEGITDASDAAVSAALAHVQLTEVAMRATAIVRAEVPAASELSQHQDVAPITTGAIYQVWPTQAEFQADLLFYIAELDAAPGPVIDEVAGMVAAAVAEGRPLADTLTTTIGRSFEHTRGSAIFYASLGFYLRSGNARVREVLGHGDDAFATAIRPVYQAILDGYRLRMRAPYTHDDLAVSVGATIEGFVLQWKRQPERTADPFGRPDSSLPVRVVQMIFDQMTEPC